MSMAGEAAADARQKAASTLGYYNLKLGPTAWTFTGALGIEYNDNVDYQEVDPDADVILRPQMDTRMWWPITDKNSLNLAVGLGYALYGCRSDLDRLYVAPGSEIAFDLAVKDFLINVHDRFSITEDAYQNPAVTRQADYSRLENVVGVTANWDLNQLLLTLGYDHADYLSLSDTLRQTDGRTEVVFTRAGLALSKQSRLGLEAGSGFIDYTDASLNDGIQYGGGGFYQAQLSRYLSVNARAGYTIYSPESGGTVGLTEDQGAFYGQFTLHHRVNKVLTYALVGGRMIQTGVQLGLYGQNLDYYFLRWSASWNVMRKMTLSTACFFEEGTQTGSFEEDFTRWGLEINLGRLITQKLTAGLGYRFMNRDSSQPLRGYTINSIFLNCAYRF